MEVQRALGAPEEAIPSPGCELTHNRIKTRRILWLLARPSAPPPLNSLMLRAIKEARMSTGFLPPSGNSSDLIPPCFKITFNFSHHESHSPRLAMSLDPVQALNIPILTQASLFLNTCFLHSALWNSDINKIPCLHHFFFECHLPLLALTET